MRYFFYFLFVFLYWIFTIYIEGFSVFFVDGVRRIYFCLILSGFFVFFDFLWVYFNSYKHMLAIDESFLKIFDRGDVFLFCLGGIGFLIIFNNEVEYFDKGLKEYSSALYIHLWFVASTGWLRRIAIQVRKRSL